MQEIARAGLPEKRLGRFCYEVLCITKLQQLFFGVALPCYIRCVFYIKSETWKSAPNLHLISDDAFIVLNSIKLKLFTILSDYY